MGSVVEKKASAKKSSNQVTYSKEQYLYWYELMLRIRRFEERALMMYGQQKIRGFCHVYIGQEAVAAGIESAITKQDGIVTAYRQHGIALARGVSSRQAMAELYGKATGIVKGKGGSMHFFDAGNKYFGGNGIVGAQIPIGTGIGFAEKYKGTQKLLCDHVRRWSFPSGRFVRVVQHGHDLENTSVVHRGKQRVCHGHFRRADFQRGGALENRLELRNAQRIG